MHSGQFVCARACLCEEHVPVKRTKNSTKKLVSSRWKLDIVNFSAKFEVLCFIVQTI